jgi:hypothetical protein
LAANDDRLAQKVRVGDVRHGIVRLAAALLRHKTLSSTEVEAIVRDCGVTSEGPELPLGLPDSDEDAEAEAFSCSPGFGN